MDFEESRMISDARIIGRAAQLDDEMCEAIRHVIECIDAQDADQLGVENIKLLDGTWGIYVAKQ